MDQMTIANQIVTEEKSKGCKSILGKDLLNIDAEETFYTGTFTSYKSCIEIELLNKAQLYSNMLTWNNILL